MAAYITVLYLLKHLLHSTLQVLFQIPCSRAATYMYLMAVGSGLPVLLRLLYVFFICMSLYTLWHISQLLVCQQSCMCEFMLHSTSEEESLACISWVHISRLYLYVTLLFPVWSMLAIHESESSCLCNPGQWVDDQAAPCYACCDHKGRITYITYFINCACENCCR